jgi:hypothetical protein
MDILYALIWLIYASNLYQTDAVYNRLNIINMTLLSLWLYTNKPCHASASAFAVFVFNRILRECLLSNCFHKCITFQDVII